VRFVDAMADYLTDDQIEEIIRKNKPDVVMTTNITPSIFKAQDIMKLAKKVNPNIRTLMGGIHSTFMYPQVLSEAPETDYIVRGEGEEVTVNLIREIDAGTDKKTGPKLPVSLTLMTTARCLPPPHIRLLRTSIPSLPTGAFTTGINTFIHL